MWEQRSVRPPAWAVQGAAELNFLGTEQEAQKMLTHFQHLFDVPSSDGVLPKMNEIYIFTEEMRNLMKMIRSLLNLDQKSATVNTCITQLQKLLENPEVQEMLHANQPELAATAPEESGAEDDADSDKSKPWMGEFGWR